MRAGVSLPKASSFSWNNEEHSYIRPLRSGFQCRWGSREQSCKFALLYGASRGSMLQPNKFQSPSFKFGTVHGEPDDYANSTSVQVKNFKECIEKCSAIFDCIVASQKSPSEPCNLFLWNSVEKVKRNDSGGEGLTAFRVFTEQPSCKLNVALLLNGKKYVSCWG